MPDTGPITGTTGTGKAYLIYTKVEALMRAKIWPGPFVDCPQ